MLVRQATIVDSAAVPLEGVLDIYADAARSDGQVGPNSFRGPIAVGGRSRSNSNRCAELGLDTEIVPGVSSFSAVAAVAGRELTIPEVAQSVVLTRLEGGKTPMPPGETVRGFAQHRTTMAIFLSAARSGQLQDELLAGGYPAETPCLVAYRVTWPEELVVDCRLDELAATMRTHKLWKHTLVLVGPALAAGGTRSHLYHPGHFHGFRRADPRQRLALRAARGALAGQSAGDSPGRSSGQESP